MVREHIWIEFQISNKYDLGVIWYFLLELPVCTRTRFIPRRLSVVHTSSLNHIDPAISICLFFAVFVLVISFQDTSPPASSTGPPSLFSFAILFIFVDPCPPQLFLTSFQIPPVSLHVYSSLCPPLPLSNPFKPFHPSLLLYGSSPPSMPSGCCPRAAPPCWSPHQGCPNLPSRMTMHSRMAIRAPVLRPAEERNASPWHIRTLPWRWHGHTRRVKVLVPLSDGSPPSHTTMGSSYSSWVRWLKRRRLAMMLAVLSVMKKDEGKLAPLAKKTNWWFPLSSQLCCSFSETCNYLFIQASI